MIALLAVLFCGIANAQIVAKYNFRLLDAENGLRENNVRNMIMLPDGMMCIHTPSEINLYNGASCKSYIFDPAHIPYTEYSGKSEMWYDSTEGGRIWLSSRDHIWAFNLKDRSFSYDAVDNSKVARIFIDNNGSLWTFGRDGEISIHSSDTPVNFRIKNISEEPIAVKQWENTVWMLFRSGDLVSYDIQKGNYPQTTHLGSKLNTGGISRVQMETGNDGTLYLMTDKKILRYYPESDETKITSSIPASSTNLFTTIAIDKRGYLWIGSARSGVVIISPDGDRTELPYLQTLNGRAIHRHSDINRIYADPNNGVWIATQTEGLLYWHPDIIRIQNINRNTLAGGTMQDESIKCMAEDSNGNILLGTINGLLQYNPQTGVMSVPFDQLRNELCISLYKDHSGTIWLGTFYNGLYSISGKKIRHYSYPEFGSVDVSYLNNTPNHNCVRSLTQDADGNYWISVYGGLGRFDKESGEIHLLRDDHPQLDNFMMTRDIHISPDGVIFALGDNGQFGYDPAKDSVVGEELGTFYSPANQAITDSDGNIWLAGGHGLDMIEPSGKMNQMLKGNTILSLAEDVSGTIWASTFDGIFKILVERNSTDGYLFTTQKYNSSDGISCGSFFQNSVLCHSNGNIYFGGTQGFCMVSPQAMHLRNFGTKPIISSFRAAGQEIDPGSVKLSLKHNSSPVSISFTNLNYANPLHTLYRYRLEPSEKEWNMQTSVNIGNANYTFLPPGNYRFIVQAAMNGNDWSPATVMEFTVTPPFYRSIAAYIIYFILFIAVLALGIRFFYRMGKMKLARQLREERRRRQDELNEMKFQFFTNVSHELKTPLSLILLPLESLMEKYPDAQFIPTLETMHRNAVELLDLVNHILDFKKVDTAEEKVNLRTGDISEFVGINVQRFKEAMDRKNIMLVYEDESSHPLMSFDSRMMKRIIANLISNALKFTPEGGTICVRLYQHGSDTICLEVTDSGIGIPEKELKHIFERFYRSSNAPENTGSGIGLSMVKHYTDLHKGTIDVRSKVGVGTSFVLSFPTTLAGEDVPSAVRQTPSEVGTQDQDKPYILVVDDNEEFRTYLAEELSSLYRVGQASNGLECMKKIGQEQPQIVICDVMMPQMDGFQVTKAIKDNVETSHIPVILLTARMSEDTRQEGYETGADSYITKPFKMNMLKARLKNLLDDRTKRLQNFSAKAEVSPMHLTITTVDQKLMERIMDKLDKNMGNPDYSVEDLAHDVGMHRMNLYRKIQSLYSMTPSEFMRTMRLKRAAQIIRDDANLPVSEVAEMVGFNTTKYFTKYFKDLFGVVPSQYGRNNDD